VRLRTPASQQPLQSPAQLYRIAGACLILIVWTDTPALLSRSVDVDTIVQRWLQVSDADFDAALGFGYCERVRDDDGTKTYEVILSLRESALPMRAQISRNGRASMSPSDYGSGGLTNC